MRVCKGWGEPPTVPADLTGHTPLHLDDIRGAGEAEAPQDSLPALQLVHLQDRLGLLQLPLGCPDICSDLRRNHTGQRRQ